MRLNKVLKLEDLAKIYAAIDEEGYGDSGLEIILRVRSKEILDKVNEQFYYEDRKEGTPPDTDEVIVTIGGTTFKYVVDDVSDEFGNEQ